MHSQEARFQTQTMTWNESPTFDSKLRTVVRRTLMKKGPDTRGSKFRPSSTMAYIHDNEKRS